MKTKIFQTKKDIEKEMASYGDGTRRGIIVAWNNAEQRNGKTHFLTPQQKGENCEKYFDKTKHIFCGKN